MTNGIAAVPDAPAIAPHLPTDRWRAIEIVFWLLALAAFFVFPNHRVLGSQILITGLFAVSLDLILGYAGIVSLGHAAFFGIGAYAAGLLAVHGWGEPISGLLLAGLAGAILGFATSFLVVRGADLARLMVTLGIGLMLFEAANQLSSITGGADGLSGVTMGKLFGLYSFDLRGSTAYLYSLGVLFLMFVVSRRIVSSPFGLSLRGIRENVRRMPAIGAPVARRLIAIYTIGADDKDLRLVYRAPSRWPFGASQPRWSPDGTRILFSEFCWIASEDCPADTPTTGAHLFTIRPDGTGLTQLTIAHHYLSDLNPVYWEFWLGLLLVVVVLFARGGILGAITRLRERIRSGGT